MYRFKLKTNLVVGKEESSRLGDYLVELGFANIGLIIDQGVAGHQQTQKILSKLKASNFTFDVFTNEAGEPDYDYLDAFKEKFSNKNFDCLVGIGGGSTLDLTKGIATLLTNTGEAISFRGFPELKNKPLPVIAIPTTAGTGSEVTYNAVFTDSKEKKKLGINSEDNYPMLAIIDPLFTVGAPESVTVSSGADALVHTLESFVHKDNTPISRMYSKEAFRLLFNNLTKVLNNPNDLNIRTDLALGAYLAGTALINSGSGPSGAFSYPLGAVYKVPHGYAGAIFLPFVTKINIEKGYEDYAQLYDLIEGANKEFSCDDKNNEFSRLLFQLMESLGVYKTISTYKLESKDVEFLIDQYDALKAAIEQNPIEITKEDVRQMMNNIFMEKSQYARV